MSPHLIWGIVTTIAILCFFYLVVGWSIDNAKLTRQMTDRDADNYKVCLQVGHSPTECRVGEYGSR